ncbi:hypothetical protein [Massilia endophytica]|uniref:hypothetical protein n=1 Tax=Massilia endophytica TaxID=2899220 RepID=UPI001E330E33|nr:hypothetical protein [Massilia endophytica]UGQ45403.1 hypothetical protein LSQ66_16620 [Massilia endophytica]
MSIQFGQDLPQERPEPQGRAALLVPTATIKDDVLQQVRKGAAIVGFGNHDRTVTIYYESNRFNEPGLQKWEQRARKAYDRMVENLPTTSKMTVRQDFFEQVGYINGKGITIRHMDKLKRWLEFSDALASAPETDFIAYAAPAAPKKIKIE